jgi:pimeloyl-ACP methyl ester carboxylesterase
VDPQVGQVAVLSGNGRLVTPRVRPANPVGPPILAVARAGRPYTGRIVGCLHEQRRIAMARKPMSAAVEAEFGAAYDAVLRQWRVPLDSIDIPSEYGRTRVNVCGPEGAPPLFLLHAGGATSTVWFANVAELSRGYRVYAPDLIGDIGRSVNDGRRLRNPGDLLTWLDGLLTHVGAERAHVIGHSYGGWIGLAYALRSPQRVATLSVLDSTNCFGAMSPGYLRRGAAAVLWPSAARVRKLLRWETGGVQLDPAWLKLVSLGADSFPASRVVQPRRPSAANLRDCPVPTLVLLAEQSRCHNVATVQRNVHRLMPQASSTVLRDVSHHSLPGRHADRLNRNLLTFLAGVA